jgi:hypothetical protein
MKVGVGGLTTTSESSSNSVDREVGWPTGVPRRPTQDLPVDEALCGPIQLEPPMSR